jgi:5-dehydro-2-deoxygluconokinase
VRSVGEPLDVLAVGRAGVVTSAAEYGLRAAVTDLVADPDADAVASARILWLSGIGLCEESGRSAHLTAVAARNTASEHGAVTVLSLDYRAGAWPSSLSARAAYAELLPRISIVIGTREEAEVAVGYREPDEATFALLETGIRLAIVKSGANGVLARDRRARITVPAAPSFGPVSVAAGTERADAAADAFGGALCFGLIEGWPLERTIRFAVAAEAIVASRRGGDDAMPTYEETDARMAWAAGREGLDV